MLLVCHFESGLGVVKKNIIGVNQNIEISIYNLVLEGSLQQVLQENHVWV